MGKSDELVQRGNTCMDEMRFDDALEFFEQAISIEPENPDLWNHAGVALRALGRHTESSEYFVRSLKLDPRDRHSS